MRKSLTIAILFIICTVIIGQGFANNSDEITLKLNLKPGDKFKTTTINDHHIKQNINGMSMDVNQHIEMIIFTEVINIDESGIYDLKVTYGDMKNKMDMPHGSIAFDTANPDSNEPITPELEPMVKMYTMLKGMSLTMKIDSLGKTKSIEGIDEMLDVMFENIIQEDLNASIAMKEMMRNFYNEKSIKEMSKGMFGSYPETPVAQGDVWDTIMNFGSEQFPMDIDTTCMLKDVNGGIATIEITSKMDMGTNDGKVVDMGGMKMNMILSGVMNGYSKIDQATGWNMESEMEQSFNGSLKLEPSPQMPEGMAIPMSIKGKVSVKSEKI